MFTLNTNENRVVFSWKHLPAGPRELAHYMQKEKSSLLFTTSLAGWGPHGTNLERLCRLKHSKGIKIPAPHHSLIMHMLLCCDVWWRKGNRWMEKEKKKVEVVWRSQRKKYLENAMAYENRGIKIREDGSEGGRIWKGKHARQFPCPPSTCLLGLPVRLLTSTQADDIKVHKPFLTTITCSPLLLFRHQSQQSYHLGPVLSGEEGITASRDPSLSVCSSRRASNAPWGVSLPEGVPAVIPSQNTGTEKNSH